jgi:hypothetical protein
MSLVTGNKRAPLVVRRNDLNETPAEAVLALLRVEHLSGTILEPCCGPGAIVRVLRDQGHRVLAHDLCHYGSPYQDAHGRDFLMERFYPEKISVVLTNPPFKLAAQMAQHALTIAPKVIFLLRLAFLEAGTGQSVESVARSFVLDRGLLARVYVFRNRLPMMHREGWAGNKLEKGAMAFAWFVWERDHACASADLVRISWVPQLVASSVED